MARPSNAAATWQVEDRPGGPVRMHPPAKGKRSWRLTYLDDQGVKRERTALSRAEAETLGAGIAKEIGELLKYGPQAFASIREADAWYRTEYAQKKRWSPKYRSERRWVAGLVEGYRPGFGDLPCSRFDGVLVMQVLNAASRAGHPLGTEHYRRVGAYLSGLFNSGTGAGFFQIPTDPRRHPMFENPYNVALGRRPSASEPKPEHVRPVTEEEIPTHDAVEALAGASERLSGVWWNGLRFRLMAGAGLRIGEHVVLMVGDLALTADGNVDADKTMVHVWRQAYEVSKADAGGGPTLITDAPPKWDSDRWAFYDPTLVPALQRRVDEIRAETEPGADISGKLLFPDSQGGISRPGNVRGRLFNPAADAAGWARKSASRDCDGDRLWTLHSTRHVYATWLLREIGMPLKVVADFLGHKDSTFTERRYVPRRQDVSGIAMAAWRNATRQPVGG